MRGTSSASSIGAPRIEERKEEEADLSDFVLLHDRLALIRLSCSIIAHALWNVCLCSKESLGCRDQCRLATRSVHKSKKLIMGELKNFTRLHTEILMLVYCITA